MQNSGFHTAAAAAAAAAAAGTGSFPKHAAQES